jgi:hypothetical protein
MKNNKQIIVLVFIIALAVSIASAYAFFTINSGPSVIQQTSPEIKERPIGDIDYGTPSVEEQNPTLDPQKIPQDEISTVGVTISYAGGSPLQIRILIDGILQSGTCSLSISKNSKEIISQTAEIFATASSTTCKGFTIDSTTLEKGTYTIKIDVESAGIKGTASQKVTI